VKPYLLLSTRQHAAAAAGEWRSTAAAAGLAATDLVQLRLDQAPLGRLDTGAYSGFILGGSDFCASAPGKSPLQQRVEADLGGLLDAVLEQDLPFFGLCYGVGLLTCHLGGEVDGTHREDVGPVPVTLTEAGRADPLLDGLPDVFHAFVGHKEAARRLPASAVLLAVGDVCPAQLFRVGANVYASQFHPELDAAGLVERMRIYQDYGYFDPSDLDRLAAAAYASPVNGTPGRLLRNFVRRHAR
jgi:GMP synthase (glutamine-hydrolysing)